MRVPPPFTLFKNIQNFSQFPPGGLNKENIFDISLLADKFRAEALRNKCVDYIFDNASSIDDERFGVLTEGVVMASLAKKFVLETKKEERRPLWVTN